MTLATTSVEELTGGDVVEKEKRTGALDEYVVHTVIDEITADRVVNSSSKRNLEFCAHTISRCDENRLRHVRKRTVEHSAEASDFGKRPLVESRAREFFDSISCACRGIDIDTGVA